MCRLELSGVTDQVQQSAHLQWQTYTVSILEWLTAISFFAVGIIWW